MRKIKVISFLIFLINIPLLSYSQQLSFSGNITHFKSAVSGANIHLNNNLQGVSDRNGFFEFKNLTSGRYNVRITHLEYKPVNLLLELRSDTTISVELTHEEVHELNEVIVSDTRNEKIRKENQLNVTRVNQDFLQRNMAGSLMQTLDKLPGVNAMMIGSGQSKPQIRGLGFNQVVVVESGVKHEGQQWGADHGLEIDQFASGNVEIVKGSASYIYGSDAIAGVVNVLPHSAPALHTFGVNLNTSFMSNSASLANSLNVFGRKHKWYFDTRLTWRDYGDYRVPTEKLFVYDYEVNLPGGYVRNSAGKERNVHFSAGRITEKLQTRFSFSNVYSKSGFFANAHGLEPRNVNTELHDASHRDILLPNQRVNHLKFINNTTLSLGKHLLNLDAAYQRNDRQERSQYVNHGFMPSVYPLEISPELERQYNKDVFSVNLRDEVSSEKNTLSYGINLEHQHNDIGGWGFLIPRFSQIQAGGFVYDKYKWSEKTLLHAALRYDFSRINILGYTDWFTSPNEENGAPEYLVRAENYSRSFDNLNWSVGINHSRGLFDIKANVGTSFRVPLAKELAASGVNYHYFRYEKGNKDLSPERSYQADLGVFFKQDRLQIEVTPFFNYFPNYIYLNPTSNYDYLYGAGNQVFEYEQSRVTRYGAELRAEWKFLPGWSSTVLGEYLYNRQLSGTKKGYNLPFSPPPGILWNLSFEPGNAYFSLDVRYKAEQNRIVPPERVTPAYTLLDLSAGTHFKVKQQKWNLTLQVSNLTNKKYLNHTSFYRLIDLPEIGRNIVVTLKIPVIFAI